MVEFQGSVSQSPGADGEKSSNTGGNFGEVQLGTIDPCNPHIMA